MRRVVDPSWSRRMLARNTSRALISLVITLGMIGCGFTATFDPQKVNAAELFNTAQEAAGKGKWTEARTALKQIEQYFPGSREFPKAKLLMADSFFFEDSPSYPEAQVEYESFLNYFPRSESKDYVLYQIALCQYASIESAERDQAPTQKAIKSFERLIAEAPGSVYTSDARSKINQCNRRLAEHELMVGLLYLNTYHFSGAERRLKMMLERYADYADLERAYYYLAEALRQKAPTPLEIEAYQKEQLSSLGKETWDDVPQSDQEQSLKALGEWIGQQREAYIKESKTYYQKLTESYPNSDWGRKAKDRLIELGTSITKLELDS